MSLLGRLEDLSLTDIIQIVFLSRRTGILEIIDEQGRHTVLFRHGLIVNASSPATPDLGSFLVAAGLVSADMLETLRKAEDAGVPVGSAAVEMNVVNPEKLGEAVHRRIATVISPLLASRDGEFNFILSESLGPLDIEYEPEAVFREGGIAPQKILGDGEKVKPLKGLEETMRAGKALLRGTPAPPSASAAAPPSSFDPELEVESRIEALTLPTPRREPPPPPAPLEVRTPPEPVQAPEPEPPVEEVPEAEGEVVRFPSRDERIFDTDETPLPVESLENLLNEEPGAPRPPAEEPEPVPAPAPAPPPPAPAAKKPAPSSAGEFRIAEAPATVRESRNVVIFERDPLVRVAARRAFTRKGVRTFQFGVMEDTRNAIADLLRENHFFVTFLELTAAGDSDDSESLRLLQAIKRKNRHLPVVVIDRVADLRRRHSLLREGADMYLTRPSEDHLQPGLADEELALFADELVLFAEKAFSDWEQLTGTFDEDADVGRQFYDIARKERINRTSHLLKQLIHELSNPNDISQVTQTILRLASEYVDRAVIFVAEREAFRGLGGFGTSGEQESLDGRARRIRIPRPQSTVLDDVAATSRAHRGKLRRSTGNVALLGALGRAHPTEVLVLPIIHRGEVVGILYGDNAEHRSPIDDTSGLEIFLSEAGLAFGSAVFARRKQLMEREERER